MQVSPNLSKVIEFSAIDHELTVGIADIRKMHDEAVAFLEAKSWSGSIKRSYLGLAHPGIVAVFLFHIAPDQEDVDEWIWVIVGDLPPAYITCERAPNPAMALDQYMGAIEEWIAAVRDGQSVDNLIPINAPASVATADKLESRVTFLDEHILSQYSGDLNSS
jgi:hypothetical protein